MPAPDHREAVGVVEERRPRNRRHLAFARVDQLRIATSCLGRGTHAEQPVLGVVDHLAPVGHVLGDELGDADAEVHVGAVGDVEGGPLRHLVAGPA